MNHGFKKFFTGALFIITLTALSSFCYHATSYKLTNVGQNFFINDKHATRIENTHDNKFGIKDTDTCWYIETNDQTHQGVVVCSSGALFINIHTIKGSATGTPSHLYFSNYLGYNTYAEPNPHLAGGGTRITYCVGPCTHP